MAEIIKTYKETLPALRVIGKRYTHADFDNGFGGKWGEWFANDWFAPLDALGTVEGIENGYLGFMRCDGADDFEYWIGVFAAPGTVVPDGYGFLDVDGGSVGICWVKGNQDDGSIYGMHDKCVEAMNENGMEHFRHDEDKYLCSFERYNCPRFTKADKDGNVILDYGIYLKE